MMNADRKTAEMRKISFDGIVNARDLGGLKTGAGAVIRKGCLLRSANLSQASERDIAALTDYYHLRMIIDMRTPMAARMKPDAEIAGAQYLPMPLFDDAMIGVSHESDRDYAHRRQMMPDLKDLYRMMVTRPECRERFGLVLKRIMEHDFSKGAVLWHCSEGKDRCGLVTAFILSALGVPEKTIMEDYLLTNETSVARAEYYYSESLKNGADPEVAESVRNAFIVKEEYLLSAMAAIGEAYHDMEQYLRGGLGLTEELIGSFRARILRKR